MQHKQVLIYLQIKFNTMKQNNEWTVTDPSCNQRMKQLSEKRFLFSEDRISNPETKETYNYESEIDLDDYEESDILSDTRPFGYEDHEVLNWLKNGLNFALIAECIFEMEVG